MDKVGGVARDLLKNGLTLNIGGAVRNLQQAATVITGPEKSIEQKAMEKGNMMADVIMFSGKSLPDSLLTSCRMQRSRNIQGCTP